MTLAGGILSVSSSPTDTIDMPSRLLGIHRAISRILNLSGAGNARLDTLPTLNTASTSSRGPDLFASTNPAWGSDSAFKWGFKPSYDIHRARPQPRGGAVFKDEQFIQATLILNASTGTSYTTSFGSEIRLKQDVLGKVESDLVSLQPGEISIEYEGDWFYGKLPRLRQVTILSTAAMWISPLLGARGRTSLSPLMEIILVLR
ncbi:hypothetical protein BDW75DRAFT_240258 [Aspergillus navahoensis]